MKPEIADRWIKALRSGEFKQGQYKLVTKLSDGNKVYCCLGVLCELYLKEMGEEFVFEFEEDPRLPYGSHVGSIYDHESIPPDEVLEWAGMKNGSGVINNEDGRFQTLVYINDHLKQDLNFIAQIIEDNVEKL